MAEQKKLLDSKPFSFVLAAELLHIRKRRAYLESLEAGGFQGNRNGDAAQPKNTAKMTLKEIDAQKKQGADPERPADEALKEIHAQKEQRLDSLQMHLAGLAVSGGGIRSATFALGLLQGLADLKLLKRFDYISTVSGGGYIGGWLAAWTKREGNPDNVYTQLSPNRAEQSKAVRPPLPHPKEAKVVVDEESEPIRHLRSYSNYLAPRAGLLTPDTWSLLAIYARNLLLNFLILLPATVFVVTLVRLALFFFRAPTSEFVGGVLRKNEENLILAVSFVFVVALSFAFNVIAMEPFKMQEARNRKKSLNLKRAQSASDVEIRRVALRWVMVLLAVLISFGCLSWYLLPAFAENLKNRPWWLPLIIMAVVIGCINVFFYWRVQRSVYSKQEPIGIYRLLWWIVCPLAVSAVLSCWLFSIDPIDWSKLGVPIVEQGVVVAPGLKSPDDVLAAANFKSRTEALGYRFLIAPYDPPALLAELAPRGDEDALRGWKQGRFYFWPALVPIVFFAALHGFCHLLINWSTIFFLLLDPHSVQKSRMLSPRRWWMCLTLVVPSFITGALGGLLFFLLVTKGLWVWHHRPHMIATFGPPLCLVSFTICAALEIGLVGHRIEEDEREWWGRLGALILLAATFWTLLFGAVLFVPWLIDLINDNRNKIWVNGGLVAGWIITSIGGALAGRSASINGNKANRLMEILTQVAPWVFLVGLLACVSMLVGYGVDFHGSAPRDYWSEVARASVISVLVWCIGSLLLTLLMSSLIDVNLFSLHNMYANRLIRCYLGASRQKKAWRNRWVHNRRPLDRCGAPTSSQGDARAENPISGFDFDDDIPLIDLRLGRESDDLKLPAYWGPLPLINTALNLVATRELDWQERRAESFVLSPYYCGSESTGYQVLPDDDRRGNMTLGRAMAVSGAAADPNMGRHASTPVTALMTVFNTRLGWWIENPSRPCVRGESLKAAWAAESPSFGGLILKELTGQTDSVGHWVHLSDGGHFENLGAYELIRRRCRYVVVSDGGCDPDYLFEDLANLIRKCRIDFGIRIEIDTAPIRTQAETGLSQWHCAVGRIRYDDVDGGEVPGLLVYVKASITGDEPPDLQQYTRQNPTFPHQSTSDQFFDEIQFESYRALGYHVAQKVFGDAGDVPLGDPELSNQRVFSVLRGRWFPAPPELDSNFEKVSEAYERLQQALRADPNLRGLSYDLYPELGPPPADLPAADSADRVCAELHGVTQILLLMEKVWNAVKLEGYPEHPMNRGWTNQFRRCASSATVQKYWPILRSGFSQEFVRFCERELLLTNSPPQYVEVTAFSDGHAKAHVSLREEFSREWPSHVGCVEEELEKARDPMLIGHRAWMICGGGAVPFAYGFALKTPIDEHPDCLRDGVTVWIRPAYRNLGIGRECFQTLFPRNSGGILRARYPKHPPGGNKVRVEFWKSFHFSQRFRPAAEDKDFVVLERRPSG